MSRKDKVIYYTSLCASKPINACRLSKKKQKYRQWMAYRRMEGDLMLSAPMNLVGVNDQLIVNHIMNSSLGPFIEFAANDCGYQGRVKELVCNWVHSLFLKAKSAASKEDNPNWWQAMTSEFADDYWKAAVTDIETLENMNAWDVVDRPVDKNVLDGTWAFKV